MEFLALLDWGKVFKWLAVGLGVLVVFNFIKKFLKNTSSLGQDAADNVAANQMGITSARAAELRSMADRLHIAFYHWTWLPLFGYVMRPYESEGDIIATINQAQTSSEVRYLAQMFQDKFADYDGSKQQSLKAAINQYLSLSERQRIAGMRYYWLP